MDIGGKHLVRLCEELQKNLRTLKEGNKTLTVNIDVRY